MRPNNFKIKYDKPEGVMKPAERYVNSRPDPGYHRSQDECWTIGHVFKFGAAGAVLFFVGTSFTDPV